MIIRKAEKRDLKQIKELNWQFFIEELPYDNVLKIDKESRRWGRRNIENSFKSKNSKLFVALEKNKIVAFALGKIERKPPIFKSRKFGYIFLTFVEKLYRKKGTGKKLIKRLISYFGSKSIDYVELDCFYKNKISLNFWKSLGFKQHLEKMRLKIK